MTRTLRPVHLALIATLLAAMTSLVWWSGPMPARAGSVVEVNIENFAFTPAELTIQVGDSVHWTNNDGTDHTVTATGDSAGVFNSGTLSDNAVFEFLFTEAGVFTYACSFHPSMEGTITVEEAPAATPEPTASVPDLALGERPGGWNGGAWLGGGLLVSAWLTGVILLAANRRSRERAG